MYWVFLTIINNAYRLIERVILSNEQVLLLRIIYAALPTKYVD